MSLISPANQSTSQPAARRILPHYYVLSDNYSVQAALDLQLGRPAVLVRANCPAEHRNLGVQHAQPTAHMRHIEAEQTVLGEQRGDDAEAGHRGQRVRQAVHRTGVRIVREDHLVRKRLGGGIRCDEQLVQRHQHVHADEQKHEAGDQLVDAIVAVAFGGHGGVAVSAHGGRAEWLMCEYVMGYGIIGAFCVIGFYSNGGRISWMHL